MTRICLIFLLVLMVTILAGLVINSEVGAETKQSKGKGVTCEGRYVLCTSAPCIPDPQNPNSKAICDCEVNEGKSFGLKSCSERTPSTNEDGVMTLISTYSFAQVPTKPVMICPSGKPWTDCLDKPCTVDPLDPLKAICTYDIKRTSRFVTYGADCNSITCNTGFWSGATVEDYVNASKVLAKAFGMEKVPTNYCPGVKQH